MTIQKHSFRILFIEFQKYTRTCIDDLYQSNNTIRNVRCAFVGWMCVCVFCFSKIVRKRIGTQRCNKSDSLVIINVVGHRLRLRCPRSVKYGNVSPRHGCIETEQLNFIEWFSKTVLFKNGFNESMTETRRKIYKINAYNSFRNSHSAFVDYYFYVSARCQVVANSVVTITETVVNQRLLWKLILKLQYTV